MHQSHDITSCAELLAALHSCTLHCTAASCIAQLHAELHSCTLHCTAACCIAQLHTALHSCFLHCTAARCIAQLTGVLPEKLAMGLCRHHIFSTFSVKT